MQMVTATANIEEEGWNAATIPERAFVAAGARELLLLVKVELLSLEEVVVVVSEEAGSEVGEVGREVVVGTTTTGRTVLGTTTVGKAVVTGSTGGSLVVAAAALTVLGMAATEGTTTCLLASPALS